MPLLLGIDTGGTYTDAVLFDEEVGVVASAKALTTRHDLAVGIGGALDAALADSGVRPAEIALVSLSTTLATNALVEGQGGRVCLVFIGFERSALDLAGLSQALKGDPHILVAGGHDALGERQRPLDLDRLAAELEALDGPVSGFAVTGQFAVRNPEDELAVRDFLLARTGRPVTCSHELSSKLDGPRRALTCVLNARLINMIHHLIAAAESLFAARGIEAPLMVVRGDGALISAAVAKVKPIETILSGPAASLVGAAYLTGVKDALVSDIGGTTTDIAVLRRGQPRLDREGATVGGWRTMVRAVAMQTVGLGGDSEVHALPDGLAVRLGLGPRRVIPLSLFALEHGALLHATLERQGRRDWPGDLDGRFALTVGRESAHSAALRKNEAALLEALADGPLPLDKLIRNRLQIAALDRLVACGLVMLSALTPSDAAHVLGLHEEWDVEAARKGAALFAKQSDARGRAIAADAEAVSRWIVETLVRISARTLLEKSIQEDGFERPELADRLLAASSREADGDLVRFHLALGVPVVGLGASAPIYYPEVAKLLRTESLVPEHAGVANAVGAVVGRVRVTVEASIAQPEPGRYRAYSSESPRDFPSLGEALSFAETSLAEEARRRAVEAGAEAIEIKLARADKTATIEGEEIFLESRLTATASGRPSIAT
jgi:N-methylhydantoinase A/oxoprolinase/acetone carboxylase beta subunit